MADKNVVETIRTAAGWVHVDRPNAYEAFAQGKYIFDVSPDGHLIDAFIAKLRSGFGVVIVRPSPFYFPNLPGVSVYFVHHECIPKSGPVKAASTISAAPKSK
jgi:hypothetical protein